MPIEFSCPNCQQTLRVPDETAGKQARCPKCQTVIQVPAGSESAPATESGGMPTSVPLPPPGFSAGETPRPPAPAPDSGSSFTEPASSPENPFAYEDKSDFAGQNPFAYAAPPGGAAANPYSPPAPLKEPVSGAVLSDQIRATSVDAGDVINYAIEVWKANLGLLVGVFLFLMAVNIGFSVVDGALEAGMRQGGVDEVAIALLGMVIGMASSAVQLYLGIGQSQISLRLARGQRAEFGDVFQGGPLFLPVLGFAILFGMALVLGLILLIIPGIMVAVLFWPFYYLIVDEKCSFNDAFGMSYELAKGNIGTILLLGLAAFGIALLGLLALCVGYLFALPLVNMLWVVCYLMMSGQLSTNASYPPRRMP